MYMNIFIPFLLFIRALSTPPHLSPSRYYTSILCNILLISDCPL